LNLNEKYLHYGDAVEKLMRGVLPTVEQPTSTLDADAILACNVGFAEQIHENKISTEQSPEIRARS
jgi:hypothetical protein